MEKLKLFSIFIISAIPLAFLFLFLWIVWIAVVVYLICFAFIALVTSNAIYSKIVMWEEKRIVSTFEWLVVHFLAFILFMLVYTVIYNAVNKYQDIQFENRMVEYYNMQHKWISTDPWWSAMDNLVR